MDLQLLLEAEKALPTMPPEMQQRVGALIAEARKLRTKELAKTDFMTFVQYMWPGFIHGRHHEKMARAFEKVARGEVKRLIINMPPRHTKSEFASYLLPAWFLGLYPAKKIIQASNTGDLAVGFGRKVRNLIDSERYKDIFPATKLQADSKAAGRWATSEGADYFAIGVGGTVTGKGADILIIDDPHALTLDTEVATTTGFKTVADIAIGDYVFSPDGHPVKVVGKSAVWDDREIYEVSTVDGAVIHCDGGHLWTYRSDTKVSAKYTTATTRALAVWAKKSNPVIPLHSVVQFPTKTLPVDPYVLGAWLGDGTTGLGRMTAHPEDMPEMRAQFHRAGYTTTTLTDPYSFGVLGLRAELRELGVLENKYIPEAYLTAAPEQRLQLLRGLMDTDGTVSHRGQCSFDNANIKLVEAVQQLVHSFGVRAKIATYKDPRPNHKDKNRVTFVMGDCFSMARKVARARDTENKRGRGVTVVKTERRASVQCITVDNKDGLFLVGRNYVVTHNSEQEAALAESNPEVYDKTYEWYTSGPRQRLQPGGSIIVVMTRWAKKDLSGQVLKAAAQRSGEEWEVIDFPAILPSGNPLWPEFWPLKELQALKDELPLGKWMAQYMQQPTSDVSAIVKREWWKIWQDDEPPHCEFIIMSLDTAFEKNQRSDFSAFTTWGVFYKDDDRGISRANIILLNSFKKRMEFPELKKRTLTEYKEWEPDAIIIEAKASGAPLIQELRAMGIPVQGFSPTKGHDKISRLNSVSDMFASGMVWVPQTSWAEELMEEVGSFPGGEKDDLVDSMTLAMLRYRQGGFLRLPSDEEDEIKTFRRRKAYY